MGAWFSESLLHLLQQSTKAINVSHDWPHPPFPNVSHRGLQPYFPHQEISHHRSCFCLLEFPSLLPESGICTNPSAPDDEDNDDDDDSFDKLPSCGGRDRKMETSNGEMSFPLSDECIWSVHLTLHQCSRLVSQRADAGWACILQPPGYLGGTGNVPLIWNAQSVWERYHSYI